LSAEELATRQIEKRGVRCKDGAAPSGFGVLPQAHAASGKESPVKWCVSLFCVVLLGSAVWAQAPARATLGPVTGIPDSGPAPGCLDNGSPLWTETEPAGGPGGTFASNRKFSNFIGFLSNPLQNIDPRSLTQIWPTFISSWTHSLPALSSGNLQVYGAGLNLALTDRLSVGLNQGGYAVADFNGNQPGLFRDRFGVLHDRREFGGQRVGWLNLGGFAQYTLIEDMPDQFLLTAGLRLAVPSGSSALFQGNGPVTMAPYLTFGKGFGEFHVLGTAGYQFPAGSGGNDLNLFYANLHLDRQLFGWFYPLVEFNWTYHTSSVQVDAPTRFGFIDFGNFESSGNIVTLAVGANAVLVRDRLELGAVYSTPLATQRNFDFDGLLVKMVMRF
jgi:hypothetical protein